MADHKGHNESWIPLTGPLYAERRAALRNGPERPPLIVLHGFTQTSRSFDPLIEFLDPRWTVIRVDLPGHGHSDQAQASLPEIADLVAETCGHGVYLGYSMGGRVALHLALRHQHLTERLALIGATPGIIDDNERDARRNDDDQLAKQIERDGVSVFIDRWLENPLFAGLPKSPTDITDRKRNTAAGLASSLRHAGTGTQAPLWDQLSSLQIPITLIVGAEDHKFAAIGHQMAETIGARASLHVIPESGHTAHLEQPASVGRIINQLF